MWLVEETFAEVKNTCQKTAFRQIKDRIDQEGFHLTKNEENKFSVDIPSFLLGDITHELKLTEEDSNSLIEEKTFAPSWLKYLALSGYLLAPLPALFLRNLPLSLSHLAFLPFFIWVGILTLLLSTPFRINFCQTSENSEILHRYSSVVPILVPQALLGFLSMTLDFFIHFQGNKSLLLTLFIASTFTVGLFFTSWIKMRQNEKVRPYFGVVYVGFLLQILGVFFPILSLLGLSLVRPASLSFFALITISLQYSLLGWLLFYLYDQDEKYFRKSSYKNREKTYVEESKVLIDKGLVIFTGLTQLAIYLLPLVLLIIYFPEISETFYMIYRMGIPAMGFLYLVLIFFPLVLILMGIYSSKRLQRQKIEDLKRVARVNKEELTDKEIFVKKFFREKAGGFTSFNTLYVSFLEARNLECKTITSGLMNREAFLVISKSTVNTFNKQELKAFLLHELHHLRHDSLLLAFLEYTSQLLLMGNGILTALIDYDSREYAADSYAAKETGKSRFIDTLKKLREEKVRRKISTGLAGLNFSKIENEIESEGWAEDIYRKVFGDYYRLYSNPSIKERIEHLENMS